MLGSRFSAALRPRRLFLGAWLLCASTLATGQGTIDFPSLEGRVVDAASILSPSTIEQLRQRLAAHETETSNQVVVATVPTLGGYDIADYGIRLARHWEIGTAEFDNGVVLLIAPEERDVRIEVGYGLEGALPDATAATIIRREIVPAFRDGDFDRGVLAGTQAILAAIEGEYEPPSEGIAESPPVPFLAAAGFFLAVMALRGRRNLPKSRQRFAQAGIVGSLFGAFAGLGSGTIWMALGVGVFVFVAVLLSGGGGNGGSRPRRRRRYGPMVAGGGVGGFGGGGLGGGGFGGGGGGFGGGGASGGW